VAGGARSCSSRIEDLYGLPSVAETAALAGAGQGATLLVPRRSCPTATCAIAGLPS
jgi:cobalt-precorrin 5A hydrolase